ncbi:acetate/propionate family kinase [Candidatus Falkowbacteria bacterium]|jgi:acetate kinase|nr:acetate/propionate family kinase [Candidatus Falkowbacteria bacterium]
MQKKYLIINTGSSSKKYSFYSGEEKIYSAHFEKEDGDFIVTETAEKIGKKKTAIDENRYINAIKFIVSSLIEIGLIKSKEDIDSVGIRIVAPGEYFLTNRLIDDEYLKLADSALEKVPLHLGPALSEIKKVREIFGEDKPIIGVSDSAFHATIPEQAKLYAIPIEDSRRFGIRRFGYHGISVQSVIGRTAGLLGRMPEKVIVCHLGGGASITAVKNGQSIDTSMGFTPLEGLVMATRVGDIDAGTVLYLSEKLNKNQKELEAYFNNNCGLLGLSGKSDDIRELLVNEKNGDLDSKLALQIYVNRIKQYIGRMAAVLGGVDLLIFAGTVGERSFIMRERICDNLKFLGIELDEEMNNKSEGVEAEIGKTGGGTQILIVKTDEMEEIAKETYRLSKDL